MSTQTAQWWREWAKQACAPSLPKLDKRCEACQCCTNYLMCDITGKVGILLVCSDCYHIYVK